MFLPVTLLCFPNSFPRIAFLSTSHYENRWKKVHERMSQKVKIDMREPFKIKQTCNIMLPTLHIWIDASSNFDIHGNFDKSEVIFE